MQLAPMIFRPIISSISFRKGSYDLNQARHLLIKVLLFTSRLLLARRLYCHRHRHLHHQDHCAITTVAATYVNLALLMLLIRKTCLFAR
ncbi:Uncharacterized protein TCM_026211 [Theobroma cacao]|uniref:Uncharacterized protein n=1 Tax=Theobroma cacao TaxID=3641 RepID=A0A061F1Z6_THECC|nr:Uncharacterized protein TCM_026211 [Theobroma cacao]